MWNQHTLSSTEKKEDPQLQVSWGAELGGELGQGGDILYSPPEFKVFQVWADVKSLRNRPGDGTVSKCKLNGFSPGKSVHVGYVATNSSILKQVFGKGNLIPAVPSFPHPTSKAFFSHPPKKNKTINQPG